MMERLLPILLAATAPTPQNLPTPPVLEPVPSPFSEEIQQEIAAEYKAALEEIARSRHDVTRSFVLVWEMHRGLFLIPAPAKNGLMAEWLTPDFLDADLRHRLSVAVTDNQSLSAHVGQKLVCHCTGVEWSFHDQKRFLIRQADLVWQ